VRPFLEDVQLQRHLRLAQRHREEQAVLGRNACIFIRVREECRRRFGRDLRLVRERPDEVFGRVVAQQVSL
jgi:hypothetical protein